MFHAGKKLSASSDHPASLPAKTSLITTVRRVFINPFPCFPIVAKDLQMLRKFPAFQSDHRPSLETVLQFIMSPFYEINVMVAY